MNVCRCFCLPHSFNLVPGLPCCGFIIVSCTVPQLHVWGEALSPAAAVRRAPRARGLRGRSRGPYRLGLHDGLALLLVVILVDRAARAALAVGVDVGPTARTGVSVDEKVNEHSGLGRTETSAS